MNDQEKVIAEALQKLKQQSKARMNLYEEEKNNKLENKQFGNNENFNQNELGDNGKKNKRNMNYKNKVYDLENINIGAKFINIDGPNVGRTYAKCVLIFIRDAGIDENNYITELEKLKIDMNLKNDIGCLFRLVNKHDIDINNILLFSYAGIIILIEYLINIGILKNDIKVFLPKRYTEMSSIFNTNNKIREVFVGYKNFCEKTYESLLVKINDNIYDDIKILQKRCKCSSQTCSCTVVISNDKYKDFENICKKTITFTTSHDFVEPNIQPEYNIKYFNKYKI